MNDAIAALIAQVIGAIPTLTDAQISAMNSVQIQGEAHIEADAVVGPDVVLVMAQVHESVDAGVYAVARLAVAGILSKGLIDPASSATLIRYWTDIMEPLDESPLLSTEEGTGTMTNAAGEVVGIDLSAIRIVEDPHAPTEEEVADLGAPETVIETPAEVSTEAPVESADIKEDF